MDLKTMVNEIIATNNAIRFVLVVDNKGNTVYNKSTTQSPLIDEKQAQLLSVDMVVLRNLLTLYDDIVGKNRFTHLIRDMVHVLIFHVDDLMFLMTCDRKKDRHQIADISDRIDTIIKKHLA